MKMYFCSIPGQEPQYAPPLVSRHEHDGQGSGSAGSISQNERDPHESTQRGTTAYSTPQSKGEARHVQFITPNA